MLVRKEVELARQELAEASKTRAVGAAAFALAGVTALLAMLFPAVAGVAALDMALPRWLAWLIGGGAFLLVAGAVAMLGLRRMKKPSLVRRPSGR